MKTYIFTIDAEFKAQADINVRARNEEEALAEAMKLVRGPTPEEDFHTNIDADSVELKVVRKEPYRF